MKKFFDKAKDTARENLRNFNDQPEPSGAPQTAASLGPPTSEDVIRYRYYHGTNLGSIFSISISLFGFFSFDIFYPSFTPSYFKVRKNRNLTNNFENSIRKMASWQYVRFLLQRRFGIRYYDGNNVRNRSRYYKR